MVHLSHRNQRLVYLEVPPDNDVSRMDSIWGRRAS